MILNPFIPQAEALDVLEAVIEYMLLRELLAGRSP